MSTQLQPYAIVSPTQLRRLSDNTLVPSGAVVEQPPPAPSARPKIGIYTSYQSSQASVQEAEAWLFDNSGRKYDLVLEFMGTESTFAMQFANYFQNHYTWLGTRRLLLGATLTILDANGDWNRDWTWQQVADGIADSTWIALRNNLIAYGQGNCVLRGPHEFTNDKWSHRIYPAEVGAAKAAWQRWHTIMNDAPGAAFGFNFNPETGDYSKTGVDPFAAFPGKDYVDVFDVDLYDRWYSRAATPTNPRTFAEQKTQVDRFFTENAPTWRGLNAVRQFAVQHGLGIGFSEWGTGSYFNTSGGNHGGGDNDYFIHRIADYILDPDFPPNVAGGVREHALWEDNVTGVRPLSPTNPDQGRAIPVPKMRAAYKARFGGA